MPISFNVCVILTLLQLPTHSLLLLENLGEGRLKLGKLKSTYTEIQRKLYSKGQESQEYVFKSQRQTICGKTMCFT